MKERSSFEFSSYDKAFARDRASGKCEFPGDPCPSDNTNRVNHIRGMGIARRDNYDPASVRDITENSALLCPEHELALDQQEAYEMACLAYERVPFSANMDYMSLDE